MFIYCYRMAALFFMNFLIKLSILSSQQFEYLTRLLRIVSVELQFLPAFKGLLKIKPNPFFRLLLRGNHCNYSSYPSQDFHGLVPDNLLFHERRGDCCLTFAQIRSDSFRFVQICSELFRIVQICSTVVQICSTVIQNLFRFDQI